MENVSIKKRITARNAAIAAIGTAAAAVAAALFLSYIKTNSANYQKYEFILPFITLALFVLVFIMSLPGLVDTLCGKDEEFARFAEGARNRTASFFKIVVFAAGIHLLTYLIGLAVYAMLRPEVFGDPSFSFLRTAWMKQNTDAGHYINIAENGYRASGDDRLLIVFFPMLPYCIRLFNLVFNDSYISATVINMIAVSLSSGMIYLTFIPIMGEDRSKAAAVFALLLPGAIFMNSPMTEPLFLLFSVTGFFFLQRRRYVLAGVFTALAGFTRSLGVLLAVPISLVGIGHIVRLIKERKPIEETLIRLLVGLIISVFGTLAYLYINYSLHGDPFKFLEYQWENWNQKACPFYDSPRYMLTQMLMTLETRPSNIYSLWAPQFIAISGSLILMAIKARRLPSEYNAYFLCYFAVAIGCTWLLSSVRYLSAAIPVIAAFGLMAGSKAKRATLYILLSLAYLAYLVMYMLRLNVY